MKIPGKKGRRPNMLALHIKEPQALYASYLPFLQHGGIFIPTDKPYKLGDEVFVKLTLLDEDDKTPIAGKVVWINPKGAGSNRPAGIGVHFGELDKGATRDKIEGKLAELLKSEKPTYTM